MRITALLVTVLLAACGQTGPLFLPDEGIQTPVENRRPPDPPPASSAEPAPAPDSEDDKDPPSDQPPGR
jgi:predicted small lipoprotein YifL